MKLLKKENNKEIMYVQIHDLVTMNNRALSLPQSKDKIDSIIENLDSYNGNEYIQFEDQRDINLLKAYDFIINYEEVEEYSEEELENLINKYQIIIKDINSKLKKDSNYKKNLTDKIFLLRYQLLFYKLDHLKAVLMEKQINKNFELPNSHLNTKK